MTASAAIRLPDASRVTVPCVLLSTPDDLLAEPERHRQVPQVELQRLGHLGVAHLEHRGPLVDDGDAGAQRGEHRRVLDADDPGADHHHRVRHLLEREDAVGVEDRAPVELHGVRPVRARPGGDDDEPRGDLGAADAVVVEDPERVRVDERAGAAEDVDVVAQQLGADDLVLAADHVLGAREQVLHRDVGLHAVAGAVHLALRHARQVHDGLAQGLARDGAGVRRRRRPSCAGAR